MIKFKKILAPGLAMALSFTLLVGCSSKNEEPQVDQNTPATSTTVNTDNTKKDEDKQPAKGDKPADKQENAIVDEPVGDTNIGEASSNASGAVEEARLAVQNAHVSYSYENKKTDLSLRFNEDGSYEFAEESTFYTKDVTLTIAAPSGAKVYYTLDGTTPTPASEEYKNTLSFKATGGTSVPSAHIFRAKAYLADGTETKTAVRTYFVNKKLDGRFSTLVFSVTGNPDELTDAPNGIFAEDTENYKERGRESERSIYLEVWDAEGNDILSQFAGVRVYGGYSRQASIKSMKFYSRKSYDPDKKNFKFSEFGTRKMDGDLKEDGTAKKMKTYDKLVLRNTGNDNQFAFIRDELSQTLCKLAGFDDYEAVLPAVCFLNGEYYCFYWLHENYCDKYFKEKYGEDAPGEFFVLEGGDQVKADDDECQWLVDDFNKQYEKFANSDLTNDSTYAKLCNFMDVENYLDFFAWNIALNNWDWPNNNYKCYAYVPGKEDTFTEGVFDGRWRFLPHDMDYTYNLYGSDTTQAKYNTLEVVLTKGNERYSPLFDALLKREDCKAYFKNKTYEFINGALSPDSIKIAYYKLHATRVQEMEHFYKYMSQRGKKGDFTMWTDISMYQGHENEILDFADKRAGYVAKYMEDLLP